MAASSCFGSYSFVKLNTIKRIIILFVNVTTTHIAMINYLFQIAVQTFDYPPKVLEVDETTSPKASDFYTFLKVNQNIKEKIIYN